ncbi:MAG: hypothetical protein ABSF75_01655 [Terracidiphilus sp.]
MLARTYLLFAFLLAVPAWSQVEPEAEGGPTPVDDTQMMTPPPVSGIPYANAAASDEAPNVLSARVSANAAYIKNVVQTQTAPPAPPASPVNDDTFSLYPTFTFARSTLRQQAIATYSPSFVFYQHTTALDTINHGASLTYQDRLSPHVTFNAEDFFYRTSDVFDQSSVFSGGGVSGSSQTSATTIIAPFAQQLTNLAHAFFSYQFARDGMIGGGGSDQVVDFPAPSSSAGLTNSNTGLANSNETGAWAFYNRRISRTQYMGFSYQWTRTAAQATSQQQATGQRRDTQINSLLPFYSFYFTKTASVSISGGAQHVSVTSPDSPGLPASNSWLPEADVSVGYQGKRGNLAASYSRTITSGQGLLGAFNTNAASLAGGWNLFRTWVASLSLSYASTSNATPQISTFAGGNTVSGQASITHTFRESLIVRAGYERLHQDYPVTTIVSAIPDTSQVYGTITYQFSKPLGK